MTAAVAAETAPSYATGHRSDIPWFPCLDAYRAIGMTMVLLAHVGFATGWSLRGADAWPSWVPSWIAAEIGPVLSRMDLGLPLFFVISGFLLYRPYVAGQLAGRPQAHTGRFYRRRALRILPGYWFALTIIIVVFGLTLTGWVDWVVYYGLLQTFDPDRAFGGITQAWSIGVEATFYLLLPGWVFLTRRVSAKATPSKRVAWLLGGVALLYVAGNIWRIGIATSSVSWRQQAVFWFPTHMDLFAIGMGLAVVSAASAAGVLRAPGFILGLARRPWVSWLVALALFVVVTRFQPPSSPIELSGVEYSARQFLYGIISFFALVPAMFGDQEAGPGRRVLRWAPLVFLGTVSYSFYLFHLAVMDEALGWSSELLTGQPHQAFTGNLPLVFVLTFVVTLAFATAAYFAVERPFLRLKDRPLRHVWRPEVWLRDRP